MGRPKVISDQEVLAAAKKMFVTHGDRLSTRELAQAVGLSQPALFQRFGSKGSLFVAAIAPGPLQVDAILGFPFDPANETLLQHVRGLLARVHEAVAHVLPPLLRLGLAVGIAPADVDAVHRRLRAEELVAALDRRFAELLHWRPLRGERQPQQFTQAVLTLSHGWAVTGVMSGTDSVTDEALDFAAALLAGLLGYAT